jgi:phosphatidylglycerophosphatase A
MAAPVIGRLAVALATGAGIGYAPIAPGTFGSLIALPVIVALRAANQPLLEAVTLVICLVAGTWAASVAESHFGRKDPGPVVIDEVAGMLVTAAYLPLTPAGLLLAFLLFRALDILKPYPAARLERLGGGLGIMADDVVVAFYGNIALRLLAGVVPALVSVP